MRFSNKIVFITGSNRGIGNSILKLFASEGSEIIAHARKYNENFEARLQALAIKYHTKITPIYFDLTLIPSNNELKALMPMVKRLDILVNNAGIVTKLALEDDDDQLSTWHETMAVNLHAPLQLMKLAHLHMRSRTIGSRKGGVIINNTSIHGSRSVEFMTAYAASKAALDSLTRGLACEFATDGVRVNAIAPGVVPVERTAQAFSDPKVTDMWLPHLPIGRLGRIEVRKAGILHRFIKRLINKSSPNN